MLYAASRRRTQKFGPRFDKSRAGAELFLYRFAGAVHWLQARKQLISKTVKNKNNDVFYIFTKN